MFCIWLYGFPVWIDFLACFGLSTVVCVPLSLSIRIQLWVALRPYPFTWSPLPSHPGFWTELLGDARGSLFLSCVSLKFFHALYLCVSLYSTLGELLNVIAPRTLTLSCHRFIQFVKLLKANLHVKTYYYFPGVIGQCANLISDFCGWVKWMLFLPLPLWSS